MPSVTVIIPVFNQAALTERCVRAIAEEGIEIVAVDDSSTDTTAKLLESLQNRIKVVTHARNQGFAQSCNDGAGAAKGDYLVFLNNDTLPQRGWLDALISYAQTHPQAGAIGARLVYPNNTIQHAGVVICQDRYPRHIYAGFPAHHPAVTKSRAFQIVTAACMLVRRNIFEQAGGFDTGFRNGFEDVDLCLRLGQAGHEIHYCAESVVEHIESVAPGRFSYDRQNVSLYRERWLSQVQPDDVDYYLDDGLLRLNYEGRFPLHLEISPSLASVEQSEHLSEAGRLVRERTEEVAELLRENTRLRLELRAHCEQAPQLAYMALRQRIAELVREALPPKPKVLVISKGDSSLVELIGPRAGHFLQTERGAYAGYHPADSRQAISALELLRARGAEYLLVPATSLWWLGFYGEFRQHLDTHYTRLPAPEDLCALYSLDGPSISTKDLGQDRSGSLYPNHLQALSARSESQDS